MKNKMKKEINRNKLNFASTASKFLCISMYFYLFLCISVSNGSSGSDFLNLPTGAKSAATANIYFPDEETSANSFLYNPSFSALSEERNLNFSGTNYLEDINYGIISYSHPLKTGSLSGGFQFLNYGDIPGYTASGYAKNLSSSYDFAFSLNYATKIKRHFPREKTVALSGISLKLINQKLHSYKGSAIAIDAGLLYYTPLRNLSFSLAFKNLGTKMKFNKESFPLPFTLNTGLFYKIPKLNSTLGLKSSWFPYDRETHIGVGLRMSLLSFLDLRTGWQTTRRAMNSSEAFLQTGLTWGFGIKTADISFNYAFVPFSEEFGNAHFFEITTFLGGSKSSYYRISKYLRRHLEQGKRYFEQNDYIASLDEFKKVLKLFPDDETAKKYVALIEMRLSKASLERQHALDKLLKKAHAAYKNKNLVKAKAIIDRVQNISPDNTDAKILKENVEKALLKYEKEKLVKRKQLEIDKAFVKGKKYLKKGEIIDARVEFEKVLEFASAHKGASEYLKKIEKISKETSAKQLDEIYTRGVKYYNAGNYKKAVYSFEIVLGMSPGRIDAKAYLEKAQIEYGKQLKEEKEKEKVEIKAEERKLMKEKVRQIEVLYRRKRFFEVLEKTKKIKQEAQEQGFSEIVKEVEKIEKKIHENLAEYHFTKGYQLYQKNKIEEAIREFRTVLVYNPEYPGVKDKIEELEKQLKVKKKEKADDLYKQGLGLYNQGEVEKAVIKWEQALRIYPGHQEAKRAIERTGK